jgi:hypothetical protein
MEWLAKSLSEKPFTVMLSPDGIGAKHLRSKRDSSSAGWRIQNDIFVGQ